MFFSILKNTQQDTHGAQELHKVKRVCLPKTSGVLEIEISEVPSDTPSYLKLIANETSKINWAELYEI